MLLLSISTSTGRGSAAILEGDRALGSISYSDPHGHAERLFSAIDEALKAAGLDRSSLEAVACDIGPGSFTGVRVGVASAKGIALALNLRAIGVTSLEALAAAAFGEGRAKPVDVVASVIDAKKGELFIAAYDEALSPLVEPAHIPRAGLDEALHSIRERAPGRELLVVGELGDAPELPDALWIGRVAGKRLLAHSAQATDAAADDAAALEALYVRAPDAKLPVLG